MLTRLLRLKSAPQPSDAADGVAAALAWLVMRTPPPHPSHREARSRRARDLSRQRDSRHQGARPRRDHDRRRCGVRAGHPAQRLRVAAARRRAGVAAHASRREGRRLAALRLLDARTSGASFSGCSTRKASARRSRSACCRRSPPTASFGRLRDKDFATLQSVPRVGRKKAEQLILDLADKLDDLQVSARRRPPLAAACPEPRTPFARSCRWATRRADAERAVKAALDDGGKPGGTRPISIRRSLGKIRG